VKCIRVYICIYVYSHNEANIRFYLWKKRRKGEDNIDRDVTEVMCKDVDQINWNQDMGHSQGGVLHDSFLVPISVLQTIHRHPDS
jgi:hypothetical protein